MLRKFIAGTAAAALFAGLSMGAAEARSRHYSYDDCRQSQRNDQAAGAIIGGILGGVIGNQAFKGERGLGTVAGVVLGGVAGSQLARGDDCDRYYASHAYYDAFENARPHQRVRWRNPDSGHYGYIQAADTYRGRRGEVCRNYEQEIYVGGRRQIAEGVACRDRGGDWRIVR